MVLVNLETLLSQAKKEKYAVGAFNATDLNTARGIVSAAEEMNSPVILQFAETHSPYISIEMVADMYLNMAKKSSVPICVHLDHGETYETIIKAISLGFTSVMVDASLESYEENVRKVKEIKKITSVLDISVEAELGIMNAEDGTATVDYNDLDSTYTNPEEAGQFVQETEVEALAVAFGTVHGLYKGKPNLNFEQLRRIKETTDIPLVMHGGSGLSDEEYRRAIENGVTKINYYSTMAYETSNKVRDYLNNTEEAYLHDVNMEIINAVKNNIKEKIKIFGSENKA